METLREIRIAAGFLRQVDAAKKLRVDQTTISTWELGTRTPNDKHIKKMEKVYGRTKTDILRAVENSNGVGT